MKRTHSVGVLFGIVLAASGCGRAPDGDAVAVGAEPVKQAQARAPFRAVPPAKAARPATAAAPVAAGGEAVAEKCDHCDGCNDKDKEVEDEGDKVETVALGASPSRGDANAPVTVVV